MSVKIFITIIYILYITEGVSWTLSWRSINQQEHLWKTNCKSKQLTNIINIIIIIIDTKQFYTKTGPVRFFFTGTSKVFTRTQPPSRKFFFLTDSFPVLIFTLPAAFWLYFSQIRTSEILFTQPSILTFVTSFNFIFSRPVTFFLKKLKSKDDFCKLSSLLVWPESARGPASTAPTFAGEMGIKEIFKRCFQAF